MPFLIGDDGIIPSTYTHTFAYKMPNAGVQIINETARMVVDVQPEQVAQAIEDPTGR